MKSKIDSEFAISGAWRNPRRPLVIGHRGAPLVAPENTLESFSAALDQGADVLETDLRWTRDDALVLFHDRDLQRMTDGQGALGDHTLAEVKRLRTRRPTGELCDEPIPTLIELLAQTQRKTPLLLELKDPLFAERRRLVQLIQLLADYDLLTRAALVGFDLATLMLAKEIAPSILTGHIVLANPFPSAKTELLGPFWPVFLLNPLYMTSARRLGCWVAPLDPNPGSRLSRYVRVGVDAVLADDPRFVVRSLERITQS